MTGSDGAAQIVATHASPPTEATTDTDAGDEAVQQVSTDNERPSASSGWVDTTSETSRRVDDLDASAAPNMDDTSATNEGSSPAEFQGLSDQSPEVNSSTDDSSNSSEATQVSSFSDAMEVDASCAELDSLEYSAVSVNASRRTDSGTELDLLDGGRWEFDHCLDDRGMEIRAFNVDDWGDIYVNGILAASVDATSRTDTGWIDLNAALSEGRSVVRFELANSVFGGWEFQLVLRLGKWGYDTGHIRRDECPCGDEANPRSTVLHIEVEIIREGQAFEVYGPTVFPR